MPKIAIVNDQDEIIGAAEKAEARKTGLIHRLVRILVYNARGEILLQKRHPQAKDAPNKWDFSVAGHVDEGEDYEAAARREADEELGLASLQLEPIHKFYAEKTQSGGRIRRFNMVFPAQTDQPITPNLDELGGVAWFSKSELQTLVRGHPNTISTGLTTQYSVLASLLRNI